MSNVQHPSATILPATLSRMPPLTALRTFVAVARHLSFVGAAQELHVTTAAISQQIRVLEDHLGKSLFRRGRGRLQLTEAGHALVPGLTTAFQTVLESITSLGADTKDMSLRVAVEPAFAARWLLPRLHDLRLVAPNLQLIIDTQGRETADCSIAYAAEADLPPGALRLFGGAVIAVASPELAAAARSADLDAPLVTPQLLLADTGEGEPGAADLERWVASNGLALSMPSVLRFTDPSLLIDATIAGLGIGLARLRFVEDELETGRLVALLDQPQSVPGAYFLSAPQARPPNSALAIFCDWLLATLRTRSRPQMQRAFVPTEMVAAE